MGFCAQMRQQLAAKHWQHQQLQHQQLRQVQMHAYRSQVPGPWVLQGLRLGWLVSCWL